MALGQQTHGVFNTTILSLLVCMLLPACLGRSPASRLAWPAPLVASVRHWAKA
jgi:hypothetical protein